MTDLTPAAQALLDEVIEMDGRIDNEWGERTVPVDWRGRVAAIQDEARATAEAEMRAAIDVELAQATDTDFGLGAAAAYNYVLSILAAPPAEPPTRHQPPFCVFPRWDRTDAMWVCCHGGSNCGGCATYPQACTPLAATPAEPSND